MLEIMLVPVLRDDYVPVAHDPETGVTAVVDPAVRDAPMEAAASRGIGLDAGDPVAVFAEVRHRKDMF